MDVVVVVTLVDDVVAAVGVPTSPPLCTTSGVSLPSTDASPTTPIREFTNSTALPYE